jgi:hypothetical protein
MNDRKAGESPYAQKNPALGTCKETLNLLLSTESPYRQRPSNLWHGVAGHPEGTPPWFEGILTNASLTHLGCIEVIRLDKNRYHKELAFIPFDEIRGILFGKPSIFRLAKILYFDASQNEMVFAPLIYGLSWFTKNKFDHDGSFTRFCCFLPGDSPENQFSIGIGPQQTAYPQ